MVRTPLALLIIATGVAHAAPDPAGAKAAAKDASELASAERYVEAAGKFRAAHRLDPRPEYVCNAGVAYHRAKDLPRAQIYLGECMRRGQMLDAQFITIVRQALSEVEAKLRAGEFAPIELTVKPDGAAITLSAFDADESFIGSQVIWLPLGSHEVSISAEGYVTERRTLRITARMQQQIRFELSRATVTEARESDVSVTERPRSKVPPIVATALTLGTAGVAVWTYLEARSIMDSTGATTIDRNEYDRRIDRARTWERASWACAGATGVGVIATALLWYRASQPVTVEVSTSSAGAGVSFSGRW